MEKFTQLFLELDRTNSTKRKTAILKNYFLSEEFSDSAWTIFILTGKKLPKRIKTSEMKLWIQQMTNTSDWLFAECYAMVGDLAETITLLIKEEHRVTSTGNSHSLAHWMEDVIRPLPLLEANIRQQKVLAIWRSLNPSQTFVFNKLATGAFRVGVQARIVFKALGEAYQLDPNLLATRAIGNWIPSKVFFEQLISKQNTAHDVDRPLPFSLAYPVELDQKSKTPLQLGSIDDWTVEWKWDGIRGQLIHSKSNNYLWSRGEEMITNSFPELIEAVRDHSDSFILDGEIIAWKNGEPLPFSFTQKRIGRKSVSAKLRQEIPIVFIAYDCLLWKNKDQRSASTLTRKSKLEKLIQSINDPRIIISPPLTRKTWEEVALSVSKSRSFKVEGCMLKRNSAPYHTGRVKGDWWKWKTDPLTLDAVMIYAQAGHGRRAGLFTDYTFAVWDDHNLVPIAKAYSGLSDKEINTLDQWIKKNTINKFGPVRQVKPVQVFEIAFEGMQRSSRHKSGISLRFPRIKLWRKDKLAKSADTLNSIEGFIQE